MRGGEGTIRKSVGWIGLGEGSNSKEILSGENLGGWDKAPRGIPSRENPESIFGSIFCRTVSYLACKFQREGM